MLRLVVKTHLTGQTGVHLPANHVTLAEPLHLFQLQFLHPQNVDNNMDLSEYFED